MLSLQYDIVSEFAKYNLKAYFNIHEDCYRITLFDKDKNQNMFFVPKKNYQQSKDIINYILEYTKRKSPEIFL